MHNFGVISAGIIILTIITNERIKPPIINTALSLLLVSLLRRLFFMT